MLIQPKMQQMAPPRNQLPQNCPSNNEKPCYWAHFNLKMRNSGKNDIPSYK